MSVGETMAIEALRRCGLFGDARRRDPRRCGRGPPRSARFREARRSSTRATPATRCSSSRAARSRSSCPRPKARRRRSSRPSARRLLRRAGPARRRAALGDGRRHRADRDARPPPRRVRRARRRPSRTCARRCSPALVAELRRLTGHVEELHFLDLPGRLARRIVRLARESRARRRPATIRLDWPYTQSDLAGDDRRHAPDREPAARRPADQGLVRFERDDLVIPDLEPARPHAPSGDGRRRAADGATADRLDGRRPSHLAARRSRRRGEAARRLEPGAERAVLRSIVEATVALFDAEAASIALYDPATDRLVFEVAAGEQGQGVVGLAIRPDQGIAGYVFSTGQPLALVGRRAATRASAGPSPRRPATCRARSWPCRSSTTSGTIGVLEVLDKRASATFTCATSSSPAVFARQAAVAIRAEPRRARHRRPCCATLARPAAGVAAARLAEAAPSTRSSSAATERPRPRRRRRACGRSSTRSPGSARPIPGQLELRRRPARRRRPPADASRRAAPAPPGGPAARPTGDRRRPAGLERAVRRRPTRAGLGAARRRSGDSTGRAALRRRRRRGRHRRDRRLGRRARPSGRRRQARPERPGRARRRGRAGRRRGSDAIDVVGHGTACAGIIHGLAPGAELVSVRVLGPGQPGQGRGLRGRPRVGDRAGRHGRQPEPVVEERGDVRRSSTSSPTRPTSPTSCSSAPPTTSPAPSYPSLFVVGRVGRGPRRRRPVDVVLQPGAAGRVRGLRRRRRRRLAGRRPDRRRPATASPRRTSPGWPP